jgi:hypothetical protein
MCQECGLPMDGTIIEKKATPMKVKGITITQDTIESAITRMKSGEFTLSTIESVVSQAQNILSRSTINRAADRIIQQQRKAENITFDGKKWMWTGKP